MHSAPDALVRLRPIFFTLLLVLFMGCAVFSRPKPESAASDATLQMEVVKALSQDLALRGQPISVQSREGVIDLSGTVKSLAIKSRAGLVAASIPGVVQVHNDLLSP
jgi:osmotically-inducible protein OsmY